MDVKCALLAPIFTMKNAPKRSHQFLFILKSIVSLCKTVLRAKAKRQAVPVHAIMVYREVEV